MTNKFLYISISVTVRGKTNRNTGWYYSLSLIAIKHTNCYFSHFSFHINDKRKPTGILCLTIKPCKWFIQWGRLLEQPANNSKSFAFPNIDCSNADELFLYYQLIHLSKTKHCRVKGDIRINMLISCYTIIIYRGFCWAANAELKLLLARWRAHLLYR